MPKDTRTTTQQLSLDQAKIILSEGKVAAAEKDYDKAIELFSKVIEVFEVHEGWEAFMEVSDTLCTIYFEDFNFDLTIQVIDNALKIQKDKCSHLFVWKVKLYIKKAEAFRLQGMFSEVKKCLSIAQHIIEKEQIETQLHIYVLLLQVYPNVSLSNYVYAEELIEKASIMLSREKDIPNDLRAEYHYQKGGLEFTLNQYQLAQQSFQKAYECIQPKTVRIKRFPTSELELYVAFWEIDKKNLSIMIKLKILMKTRKVRWTNTNLQ